MHLNIVQYLLAAMISWCPPSVHYYQMPNYKTDQERYEYTYARYQSIAQDLSDVALDDNERPLFDGDDGRLKTAILVLSIASFESGEFREDVDTITPTGDHGKAYCLMQVQLRDGEVIRDRQECFRIGLSRIRESFKACPSSRLDERLAVYASGHCDVGVANSIRKFKRATSWVKDHPFLQLEDK